MSLSERPAFCTFDAELRFLAANDVLLRIVGKSRDELIGARLLDVYPEATRLRDVLLQAQRTLSPQKGRHYSPIVGRWVELEVHPVGEVLQVGFSPAQP